MVWRQRRRRGRKHQLAWRQARRPKIYRRASLSWRHRLEPHICL